MPVRYPRLSGVAPAHRPVRARRQRADVADPGQRIAGVSQVAQVPVAPAEQQRLLPARPFVTAAATARARTTVLRAQDRAAGMKLTVPIARARRAEHHGRTEGDLAPRPAALTITARPASGKKGSDDVVSRLRPGRPLLGPNRESAQPRHRDRGCAVGAASDTPEPRAGRRRAMPRLRKDREQVGARHIPSRAAG